MKSRSTERNRPPRGGLLLVWLCLAVWFFFAGPAGSSETLGTEFSGKVRTGETLSQAMQKTGIPKPWIDLVVAQLSPRVDLRKIPEAGYRLYLDEGGDFLYFLFELGPSEGFEIRREAGRKYRVGKKEVLLEARLEKVEGEIRSSLAKALKAAGEGAPLAKSISDLLAWEIDAASELKKGDRFRVLVEKIYHPEGFLRYGPIQALEYHRGARKIRAFRYKDGYYNEKGESLEKSFLKSPMEKAKVTSRFSRHRKHPIMGGGYPHLGIDYAAPRGAPVYAAARGIVESCGWNNGYGKQVVVRHAGGYVSHYNHLSRYGPGVKKGKALEQKQVVGYVGSTGYSTGPHLDYRVSRNGKFVDPLEEKFPASYAVGEKERGPFRARRDDLLSRLSRPAPPPPTPAEDGSGPA